VGMGRGAQGGILIRDAETPRRWSAGALERWSAGALERMKKVELLVVDKTGTLTEGRPRVTAVRPEGLSEDELLRLAASLERASEHPLAAAVDAAAKEKGLTLDPVDEFDAPTGKGVIGRVGRRQVALGSARFLREIGVDVTAIESEADRLRADGTTAILAAMNGAGAGVLYPETRLLLSPMLAAAAMALSSVSANALQLRTARMS